jgi:hypothetical protein
MFKVYLHLPLNFILAGLSALEVCEKHKVNCRYIFFSSNFIEIPVDRSFAENYPHLFRNTFHTNLEVAPVTELPVEAFTLQQSEHDNFTISLSTDFWNQQNIERYLLPKHTNSVLNKIGKWLKVLDK